MVPFVKFGLEFIPLLVFFVSNALTDLITATAVFVGVTVVTLAIYWLCYRTVPFILLVGVVFIGIFGGLTVALDNDIFIKIRPTVANGFLACLLFTGLATKRLFLKLALGATLPLSDEGWRVLTWRFAFFFLFLATANEFVWRTFSADTWVAYKVWGVMPMSLIFTAFQLPLINRTKRPEES